MSAQSHPSDYCNCEVVPAELTGMEAAKNCPVCQGSVKFLTREEFERILEAEFLRTVGVGASGDSGSVEKDWAFEPADQADVA